VLVQPFPKATLPDAIDLLVVDPPRSGLGRDGVVRALAARPTRLLYVACAADSLARDLAMLTASGYRVTAARLCDLFPHTEHVELVTLLQRN
jgi:tRNA/tmRNA/rRNA uracil-C5-methylase (TrmA/RlmC/RlmD family)